VAPESVFQSLDRISEGEVEALALPANSEGGEEDPEAPGVSDAMFAACLFLFSPL